jgi:hypothetical protein
MNFEKRDKGVHKTKHHTSSQKQSHVLDPALKGMDIGRPDTPTRVLDPALRSKPSATPRSRQKHNLSDGESESGDPNVVWRALRKEENPKITGVRPPAGHDPNITASAHITAGSRANVKGPWVSTTRSRKVAGAWASESGHRVAKLEIPEGLDRTSVYDLTNPEDARRVFPTGQGSSLNTAKASQEVVIKGGLGPKQVKALYEANKISVSEYKNIKKRMEAGEEIFIDDKKLYAAFRTRTKASGRPQPRVLLELPDETEY